jgi:outer membrane protein assembly factor BamB
VITIPQPSPPRLRWWPALVILVGLAVWIGVVRANDGVAFQQRNIQTAQAALAGLALLLLWWSFFSRAPKRLRLTVSLVVLGALVAAAALFRIRGVSGDLVPILEPRWVKRELTVPPPNAVPAAPATSVAGARADFPQFLGPARTAVLAGPKLATDWAARPPAVLWRQPLGAAWSGFSIVVGRAFTQEQRGEVECVTCYDLATGKLLWLHADQARYATTIAGEGPRATPTVVGDRVFSFGATGLLNCLDAATGRPLWQRDTANDAGAAVPEWGFTSSPLVSDGRVIVSAGGRRNQSLLAYAVADGAPLWGGGSAAAGYSSPMLATLAGAPQVLSFNLGFITAHSPTDGKVLWQYPWGVGYPHVAMPVVTGPDRVLFTSGYGVGAELLAIERADTGRLAPRQVWKSNRLKAKFANPVLRDGFVYGLDDGILVCVDAADGSLRWKEGRYGHGQGLLVGEHYLLMAESGELVLLRPTPDAPNELARFRAFTAKTWNPIALAGDLLLVRNDQEAACLRLPLAE